MRELLRKCFCFFWGLVVILKEDGAVTGADLVDIEENIVISLNLSKSIGRVILVESSTKRVSGFIATVLKSLV